MKEELLRHWEIQERLLQSYRFMFMTAQSVLLTGAAVVAAQPAAQPWILIPLMVIGLALLYVGVSITNARALDVSYFQLQLMLAEEGQVTDNVLAHFKNWQHQSKMEKQELLDRAKLLRSRTRQLLQVYVPLMFGLIWVVLGFTAYFISQGCHCM
jgi:hypothetical protein